MIKENLKKVLNDLPENVKLVVATKGRSIGQIEEAIAGGAEIIGENYIKEAERKFNSLGEKFSWHLLGHLQKNKVKSAVKIFDMIETLDSLALAETIDRESAKLNSVKSVLIEVNIAREPQKSGVLPGKVEGFVEGSLRFKNLKLEGLMTMGPLTNHPEALRPFFKEAKEIFEKIKSLYGNNLGWKYLSMGMSESYNIAIEEGANIVRVGTAIFGPARC